MIDIIRVVSRSPKKEPTFSRAHPRPHLQICPYPEEPSGATRSSVPNEKGPPAVAAFAGPRASLEAAVGSSPSPGHRVPKVNSTYEVDSNVQ